VDLLPAEAIDRAGSVEATDDVAAAVRDADLAFEAVSENGQLKHEILTACTDGAPKRLSSPPTPPRCRWTSSPNPSELQSGF
jgi:hypothetical protein